MFPEQQEEESPGDLELFAGTEKDHRSFSFLESGVWVSSSEEQRVGLQTTTGRQGLPKGAPGRQETSAESSAFGFLLKDSPSAESSVIGFLPKDSKFTDWVEEHIREVKFFTFAVCFLAIPLLLQCLQTSTPILVFVLYVALYMAWAMLTYATKGGPHSSAILVLNAFIIKLTISLGLWRAWEGCSLAALPGTIYAQRWTLAQYVFPAGLYAAGDMLRVEVLRNTDPGTYAVLFNLRMLFLALVWQWALDRRLEWVHWGGLLLILGGCIAKELPELYTPGGFGPSAERHVAYIEIAVLGILTAVAAVWNEFLLKKREEAGVSLQNIAMYSFGLVWSGIFAVLPMLLPAAWVEGTGFSSQAGLFEASVWAAIYGQPLVLTQTILLAVYGITTAYFLRHLSNIMREVATAVIVVLSVAMDLLIFEEGLVPVEAAGVGIVLLGVFVFARWPVAPKPASKDQSSSVEHKDDH